MEQTVRRWLEGGGGAGGALLRGALSPAGWVYGGVQCLRRNAYGRGWLKTFAAGRPVVSVGNLSAGGVGKTPTVAWLVARMREEGLKPGILLRGYRAEKSPEGADEARWLAARFPGAPVVANRDRVAGAAEAVARGAEVLVLDDGFQHLRLRRNFDLVLLDATATRCGAGNVLAGRCFPAGLLREGPSALRAADAFVLTRADQAGSAVVDGLRHGLRAGWPDTPIFTARHAPARLKTLSGKSVTGKGVAALAGTRVVAAAGIGRPEAFVATLAACGAVVTRTLAFPDHHAYNARDAGVMRLAAATNAARLVVTEKDAEKLLTVFSALPDANADEVWVLGVEMAMDEGEALWTGIRRSLETALP